MYLFSRQTSRPIYGVMVGADAAVFVIFALVLIGQQDSETDLLFCLRSWRDFAYECFVSATESLRSTLVNKGREFSLAA